MNLRAPRSSSAASDPDGVAARLGGPASTSAMIAVPWPRRRWSGCTRLGPDQMQVVPLRQVELEHADRPVGAVGHVEEVLLGLAGPSRSAARPARIAATSRERLRVVDQPRGVEEVGDRRDLAGSSGDTRTRRHPSRVPEVQPAPATGFSWLADQRVALPQCDGGVIVTPWLASSDVWRCSSFAAAARPTNGPASSLRSSACVRPAHRSSSEDIIDDHHHSQHSAPGHSPYPCSSPARCPSSATARSPPIDLPDRTWPEQADHRRPALAVHRPAGRQPGADRPDDPGPQAQDVRPAGAGWATRRSRSASRRPARPTSTSSAS